MSAEFLSGAAVVVIIQSLLNAVGWRWKNKREDQLRWSEDRKAAYIDFYHRLKDARNIASRILYEEGSRNLLAQEREQLNKARERVRQALSATELFGNQKTVEAAEKLYAFVAEEVNATLANRELDQTRDLRDEAYRHLRTEYLKHARKDLKTS
jgi:hypothetical protein